MRAVAVLFPLVVSVAVTWRLSTWLPPVEGILQRGGLWLALSLVATAIVFVLERVARRLLPLAALLKLSLVFPDQAPSRFRTALRTGTVRQLEQRVAEIKEHGFDEDEARAAEQLLELVAALSAHDRLTRGHAERVRAYSRMIGEELDLSTEDLDRLHWAGLLHDVGKLFVPAEILNKPDRLTDDEYEIIKGHPGWGAELCEPLRGWLGEWVDAVGQHHERWDGRGYPAGLAGEDISRAARIVSVADVFDVVTSARSYKVPMSAVAGRAELTACAGTQFDPDMVRAFLNIGLGRMRLVIGPLSWAAQLPVIGRVPVGPAVGAVGGALAAAASIVLGGLFHDPGPADARVVPVAEVSTSPDSPAGDAPDRPDEAVPTPDLPTSGPGPAAAAPLAPSGPEARDDLASTDEDVAVVIPALANDSAGAVIDEVEPSAHGSVEPLGDVIRFVPGPNQVGTITFDYRVRDTDGATDLASVTVVIEPVNDAPSFVPATDVTVAEDTAPQVVAHWATSITPGPHDEAGQLVAFVASAADPSLFASGPVVDPVGALHLTPAPGVSGTTTVTVHAVDSGGTAGGGVNTSPVHTFRVTVVPMPDAPVAGNDTATVVEDGMVVIPVLANDSDPDGDPLAVTAATSTDGIASTDGTTVTYAPAPDATGVHTVTYTVGDGTGRSDTATVTVTVTPTPDAPVAGDDAASLAEDGTVVIPVLGNDSDPDGDPLTVTGASSTDGTASTDGTSVTYAPAPDATGVHTVTYTVGDGTGRSDTATVTVTVTPTPDAPVAGDDAASVAEDGTVVIPVLVNDTDVDGDPLVVTGASSPDGTASTDGTSVTYVPAPDANGVHTVTYTVADGTGRSDSATVAVAVTAVNDAPGFVPGSDVTIAEDAGPTTQAGWATAISPGPADEASQTVAFTAVPADATLFAVAPAIDASGALTFTTAADASGATTLTVQAVDDGGTADGGADTGPPHTLTITVTPAPDAPVAGDDAYATPGLLPLAVPAPGVLANDGDEDGDALTAALTVAPTGGLVVLLPDGSFIYTSLLLFSGTDTFTYTVSDGTGRSDTAVVTIQVGTANMQSTWYLGNGGVGPNDWDLVAAPPAGAGAEADTDGDGNPGLTIDDSNQQLSSTDGDEYQEWGLVTAAPMVLDGPVSLQLWSTSQGFHPTHPGDYSVWLQDCAANGTGCVTVASSLDVHVNQWNDGDADWIYREIDLGEVSHTVAAGRRLQVRIMVGHHDVWIASSVAHPSALVFTEPA